MTVQSPDLHESIGQRLRQERSRLGYSEAAFGELCGHNAANVEAWELGAAHPSAAALACLSRHGVDVLYVLSGIRIAKKEVDELVLDLTDIKR